jgi:hypothetical protein
MRRPNGLDCPVSPTMRRVGPFLAALALGCGSDATGPDAPTRRESPVPGATPMVAGHYHRTDVLEAVTCTPHRPPPGGTVILDAFAMSSIVRIEQVGSRLALAYTSVPTPPIDTGTVDPAGRITFGARLTFREAPREGNRIFFVDLTIRAALERVDGSTRLVGPIAYENVFREGAPTAPVFTTCSRTGTVEFSRIGDDVSLITPNEAVPLVPDRTLARPL